MAAAKKLRIEGGVTLLGAAPDADGLAEALAAAPALVCADGGANNLTTVPTAIIGDLDSLEDAAAWRDRLGAHLIHVEEQDSTDLEKCLRHVEAAFFICVGFHGGRLDHELAALHALVADPRPIVMIGAEDVVLSAGRGLELDLQPDDRFSVFPLRRVVAGRSRGLRWPLDGLVLEAGEKIGTSNMATGRVMLRFDRPGALLLLPRIRLDVALGGLLKRAA
ncbi:thiamine diphosphokinase [Pikeienuella piscinae]|uniref:Thiamine diphosphokinase n=1 Tax=Pikeienuella piscinae TaxID=2748098 RepID=A0A7L5BWQ3_9RHOB|nr:thiamine diphosphokinase [Pikeienuella piscinae]QIE54314.1 thiamine diphosphokinase [Pikeienuella piscinae]